MPDAWPEIVQVAAFARVRLTLQPELSFRSETLFCAVNRFVVSVNTNLVDFAASLGVGDLDHCQP
jgi:hypothetical protein